MVEMAHLFQLGSYSVSRKHIQRFRPCLRQQLLKPFILHQCKYLSFQMRNVAVHGMVLLLRQLTGNFLDILRGFFQV